MKLENQIIEDIKSFADEKSALHCQRFFKTGKGEYAEGDLFYGLKTPVVKSIVKKYCKKVSLQEIENILHNPYHEVRCVALFFMVQLYDKGDDDLKTQIYHLYLRNVDFINNWDLVDITAYKIIGKHIYAGRNFCDIYKLADSGHLWSERIAVVSQMYLIKKGEFDLILELGKKFLSHEHDLMHKAVGWMLREMGKVDEKPLYEFLERHSADMPRTMLRYAIEKLPEGKRLHYLQKDSNKSRKSKMKKLLFTASSPDIKNGLFKS